MKKADDKRRNDMSATGNATEQQSGSAPVEYQVMTPDSIEGLSQPFATLAGAQRALEKIRTLHPGAYIASVRGSPADRR